jgi:aspartate 1-decarboxylase
MRVTLLRAKLHQATVTQARLDYHGSLTIDPELMEAVSLVPYEAIVVSNLSTGQRAETYAIPGERGKRQIELNGAMARIGTVGDRLIVMSFAQLEPEELASHRPQVIALDHENRIVERFEYPPVSAVSRHPRAGAGTRRSS